MEVNESSFVTEINESYYEVEMISWLPSTLSVIDWRVTEKTWESNDHIAEITGFPPSRNCQEAMKSADNGCTVVPYFPEFVNTAEGCMS